MYKIIGADGREYGPVSGEQLRQWVAEGRANAQTRVQAEGTSDWRSLAEMPEFAPHFSTPPPIAPPAGNRKPPGADKKIAAGLCGILLGGFGIHKFILGYTSEGVLMLVLSLVGGLLTCGLATVVFGIIGLVEGILYLTKSDEDFVATYVIGKKGWF